MSSTTLSEALVGLRLDFKKVANRLLSLYISLVMTVQKNASGKTFAMCLADRLIPVFC